MKNVYQWLKQVNALSISELYHNVRILKNWGVFSAPDKVVFLQWSKIHDANDKTTREWKYISIPDTIRYM